MQILILCLAIAFAYRGKGGLFEAWGVKSANARHGIGALIVGTALAFATGGWLYLPSFAAGWMAYTKPTTKWLFSTIDAPTKAERLKAIPLAYARQALILPLAALTYYVGKGSLWGLVGFLPLGFIYYVGGMIQRKFSLDGVAVSEWLTGIAGIMFGILAVHYG